MDDANVAKRELAAAGFGDTGDGVSIISPPWRLSLLPGLVLLESPVKDMAPPSLVFVKSSLPLQVGDRLALGPMSSVATESEFRSGDWILGEPVSVTVQVYSLGLSLVLLGFCVSLRVCWVLSSCGDLWTGVDVDTGGLANMVVELPGVLGCCVFDQCA